jgi:hypothetical protein
MIRPSLCVLVSLAWLLAPLPNRAAADEKPVRLTPEARDLDELLGTDWYGVYLQGKKVGFFQSSRTRIGKGADAGFRESVHLRMKLVSLGQKSEMETRQTLDFDATPPFALRRGEGKDFDGKTTQHHRLERTAKGYAVTYAVGQDRRTKQVPSIDYTLADALTEELWIRRGAKVGDRIVSRSFEIKDVEIDLTTSKVLARKTSLVNGVKLTYYEVHSVSQKEQLPGLSRHDQNGRLLSGTIAGIIELRLEPEEQARNIEYSADLFVLGMVRIDRKLGNPLEVSGLTVEVVGKEAGMLASGPRQTVLANKSGTHTLKLGKAHSAPVRATPREIEEALQETTAYPITDPKIQALAKRAVGDARTPREKVERLVDFVYDFIDPTLTGNAPNIYDLLERKKGDCKAYALLFTTLARAAGVPAREVSGLVYMGDDQKAFGGHAWNEVVLDGCWVPVDASCRETEVDATHISFGNERQATRNWAAVMGKLSFRVIEVQRGK